MGLLARRKTPSEELKNAAIAALVDALDAETRAPKPRLTGTRAVATGVVLYAAGFAAVKGRRFVSEHLAPGSENEQAQDEIRDEEREASEDDQGDDAAAGGDDESSLEAPTPSPERKPVPRLARKKDAQSSLELPRQRRARLPVSGDRA